MGKDDTVRGHRVTPRQTRRHYQKLEEARKGPLTCSEGAGPSDTSAFQSPPCEAARVCLKPRCLWAPANGYTWYVPQSVLNTSQTKGKACILRTGCGQGGVLRLRG